MKCPECGEVIAMNELACSKCRFWLERVRMKDDPKVVRANGHSFYLGIGNVHTPSSWRGHGGRTFEVIWLDESRGVTRTVDLWHNGEIPERFRDRLPDNARLVSL